MIITAINKNQTIHLFRFSYCIQLILEDNTAQMDLVDLEGNRKIGWCDHYKVGSITNYQPYDTTRTCQNSDQTNQGVYYGFN